MNSQLQYHASDPDGTAQKISDIIGVRVTTAASHVPPPSHGTRAALDPARVRSCARVQARTGGVHRSARAWEEDRELAAPRVHGSMGSSHHVACCRVCWVQTPFVLSVPAVHQVVDVMKLYGDAMNSQWLSDMHVNTSLARVVLSSMIGIPHIYSGTCCVLRVWAGVSTVACSLAPGWCFCDPLAVGIEDLELYPRESAFSTAVYPVLEYAATLSHTALAGA